MESMQCSDTSNVYHDLVENNNESLFLSEKRKCYCKCDWDFKKAYQFFIYMNNKLKISKIGQNITCTLHIHKKIDDIEELIMIEKTPQSIPYLNGV